MQFYLLLIFFVQKNLIIYKFLFFLLYLNTEFGQKWFYDLINELDYVGLA